MTAIVYIYAQRPYLDFFLYMEHCALQYTHLNWQFYIIVIYFLRFKVVCVYLLKEENRQLAICKLSF